MVGGLLKFRDYFRDYTDSYVLIGGAACDILFTENASDFRTSTEQIVERLERIFET